MSVYKKSFRLKSADVDMFRRLRTGRLFEFMQEAAISHTEELGAGRAVTLDKGILWVVTLQRAEITRMPEYDEQISLESWPGRTMHVLFPRYCRITDSTGQVIIRSSALWALIDGKTRRFIFPEDYGVRMDGGNMPDELPLPSPVPAKAGENSREFIVPFSYVDLNGHMNNTHYFDLIDNAAPAAAAGLVPHSIEAEYSNELKLGDEVSLQWNAEDNEYRFTGLSGGKAAFKMKIEYMHAKDGSK